MLRVNVVLGETEVAAAVYVVSKSVCQSVPLAGGRTDGQTDGTVTEQTDRQTDRQSLRDCIALVLGM